MSQPKVSIIVPIHNAGEFLEKCLYSLVNQSLKEIEIILILDYPTDGSDKIAEKFASRDSRIQLIYNTENLHTGYSRNRGLDVAKGEYIGFHDHDDYSEPQMYEKLYEKAAIEDRDVVRCNFNCVYDNKVESYVYPDKSSDLRDRGWMYKAVSADEISCVLWNHIYRTDFLRKHNIRFLDSRSICSEDSIFFYNVYDKIDGIGIVQDYLYYHVFHSSNTGKDYTYRSIKNRMSFFEKIYSLLKSSGVDESRAISFLYLNYIRSLYSAFRQVLLNKSFSVAKKDIAFLKKNILFQKSLKCFYSKKNRTVLRSQKLTVIIFSFLMK